MGAQLGTMRRADHQPHDVSNLEDRSPFVRNRVPADPRSAARVRAESRSGRTHFTLRTDRFSDLLLAVNEAVADAAEFAYCDASQCATLDVSAAYDPDSDTLAVTVDDRGRWRQEFRPSTASSSGDAASR